MTSEYEGIYSSAYKAGLYNFYNKYVESDNNLKQLVPLRRVNQFFFGTNSFEKELNKLVLYNKNMLVKHYNDYWISIIKLESYINEVLEVVDLNKFDYCPYNYFKTFGLEELEKYQHYKSLIQVIDGFLEYLDIINTPISKTIRNIIAPHTKSGEYKKFEGEVIGVLNIGSNSEMMLKFNKKGSPLVLRLYLSDEPKLYENNIIQLRIGENILEEEYQNLYDCINQQLLMDSPEEFMINNLERVCGSRDFAEIMVKSYIKKDEFNYDIDILCELIQWKNDRAKQKYINYFENKYSKLCSKQSLSNDTIEATYLNFEGINKFLLNLSEDDLDSFEVKEQINEMYYNSMHELIHSFELLYNNK
jgi:hypothetical protein